MGDKGAKSREKGASSPSARMTSLPLRSLGFPREGGRITSGGLSLLLRKKLSERKNALLKFKKKKGVWGKSFPKGNSVSSKPERKGLSATQATKKGPHRFGK